MKNRHLKYAEILFASGLIMASYSEVRSSDLSSGQQPPDLSRPGFALNLNAGLEIPDNEIPPLEEVALHGSGKSALKLAQFYRFIRHDWDKYSYWITISAEDGDPIGMHNLGYLLLHGKRFEGKSDRKSEIRARFWLERSAEAGVDLSPSELKDMGSKGL
jgi:TPR repeat protein